MKVSHIRLAAEYDAGLAVVMGHEIAHAVARHSKERMRQALLVTRHEPRDGTGSPSFIPFTTTTMKRILLPTFILLLMISVSPAMAQRSSSGIALGAQFGSPSGIGLRLGAHGRQTYDFIAAWDLNDFFYLNGHILFDQHIGNDARTSFFYGPGLFVGIKDRKPVYENETVFGLSASVGVSFRSNPFEFMVRLTPRISVIPDTHANMGGGVGFYYWF